MFATAKSADLRSSDDGARISVKFGGAHQPFCALARNAISHLSRQNRTVAAAPALHFAFRLMASTASGKHCERRREAACRVDMRSMPAEDFFRRDTTYFASPWKTTIKA
jgi:hypothetical protein